MKSEFYAYHPLVNFVYFILAMVFALWLLHPFYTSLSLFCALLNAGMMGGKKSVRYALFFGFPVILLIAVLNPLFVHRGMTILFYMGHNPVTLESILYGLCSAGSLGSVLFWGNCYNQILTADKNLYLLSRVSPALSLTAVLSLRMMDRLIRQYRTISAVQQLTTRHMTAGRGWRRLTHPMRCISILLSFAMEDGLQMAASMKARGYGVASRRTAFSLFRFRRRDGMLLACMLALAGVVMVGTMAGQTAVRFYPAFTMSRGNAGLPPLLAYAALLLLPLGLEVQGRGR